MIALQGLTLQSRGTRVGPLDLQVDRRSGAITGTITGAITGVVGPSGSGKTLLLLALAGLLPAAITSGQARVDQPIGMVFSNDALDDGRSALGNVVDAALAAQGAADLDAAVADSRALLSALGLDAAAQQRPPRFLSGGQRKRVGIARALVIRPRTLLLDDATAGLDPVTAREVVDLIVQRLADLPGACALFATQDVDTVLPRLSRTLWLHPTSGSTGAPHAFVGSVVDVAALPAPFAPRACAPFLEARS